MKAIPQARSTPRDDVRKYIAIALTGVALVAGGVGGWAATATMAGAIVAPGTVMVESYVKKVQHPTGGVVGEIQVKDGDAVEQGQLVMRLDETVARASLGVVTTQLDELAGRIARLRTERDGAEAIEFPPSLAERAATKEIAEIMAGERRLFESRRTGREGQKAQLGERINQLSQEIVGLEALLVAKSRELDLVNTELGENHKLWRLNLVPLAKYTALQREAARITGERAQLVANIARARAAVAETRLQVIALDQDRATEVMKDLREAQAKVAELTERRAAAEDMLKRVDIRAPRSGLVHQLSVHTVGGVIAPGEQIMQIVPANDALIIEARVSPRDIDQVHAGQPAVVRFPAFSQRTTPEFEGQVVQVAADLTEDPQSRERYFAARLAFAEESQPRGQFQLLPGMSAEVFIRTTERTPLSYFLKPLSDQVERTFRED
jgi:HlyD family secretion protein